MLSGRSTHDATTGPTFSKFLRKRTSDARQAKNERQAQAAAAAARAQLERDRTTALRAERSERRLAVPREAAAAAATASEAMDSDRPVVIQPDYHRQDPSLARSRPVSAPPRRGSSESNHRVPGVSPDKRAGGGEALTDDRAEL